MYRFFLSCLLLLAFATFGVPRPVDAQETGQCYVCDEAGELCDVPGEPGETYGCLGDGGIEICRGGVCSDSCEEREGSCMIVYSLLEPFGITPEDEVIFERADLELVGLLPVPGEESLYGSWACSGKLLALYQRIGDTFEPVPFEPGSFNLAELKP